MKPVLFLSGLFVFLGSIVSAQDTSKWDLMNGFPLHVNSLEHDFGQVKENSKIEFEFELLNDSVDVLIIKHVTVSCHCTTPKYSKRPVKPNKTATIKVVYDSSRIGVFSKSVFVYTNFSDQPIELKIKGQVQPLTGPKAKSADEPTKKSTGMNTNLPNQ
jgi:hypothetical protein